MTVFKLWQQMRAHIPADSTLPEGCLEAGYDTIRQGLDELRETAKWLFKSPVGAVFGAGAPFNVAVNSRSIEISGGDDSWVSGSQIAIAGDTGLNAIYQVGDDWQLLYPYAGATGTHAAQVFGDAFELPASAESILAVTDADSDVYSQTSLHVVNSYEEFRAIRSGGIAGDYSGNGSYSGRSHALWLETVQLPGASASKILHIAPSPSQTTRLRLDVFNACQADIAAGSSDLLVTETDVAFQLPPEMDVKALKPIVMQLWTGCPWFSNEKARAEIGRQYTIATDKLRTERSMFARRNSITFSGG